MPLAVSIRSPSCRRGSEGWRVSSETFEVEMYTLRRSGTLVGVRKQHSSCKSLVTGVRISTKHITIHCAQMLLSIRKLIVTALPVSVAILIARHGPNSMDWLVIPLF